MTVIVKKPVNVVAAAAMLGFVPFSTLAEPLLTTERTNMYGTPGGLIDMPTSESVKTANIDCSCYSAHLMKTPGRGCDMPPNGGHPREAPTRSALQNMSEGRPT